MTDYNNVNTHRGICLPKDIGPHSVTDIEWWYQFAFINGDQGGKYAVMSAFYQAGELPILKGHYLIFSLIDLTNYTSQNFSLIDTRLTKNMLLINLPLYLLQCPHDKDVLKLYGSLIQGKLPSPHQWLPHASIEENPVRLLYGDSSMSFKNSKDGQFDVIVTGDGIEANLKFKPQKPVSLIGGNGKPDQLYYYSFTRNEVKGYVKKGVSTEYVTGEGWFDHQWGYTGNLLTKTGWNWFGLQLEDGRELLINEFRSIETGNTFSPMANLIEPDGKLKFTRNLTLKPSNPWQSRRSNAIYPLEWSIIIPEFGLKINVSAVFPEQEMPIIGPLKAIWEGACSVVGNEVQKDNKIMPVRGKGFLELVGYANYIC
ncbi:MAG: hypothetical protein N3B21_11260 [Clostridia bacterium]|nr:hypothetical protein [Clostridia bacterium]